jgi:hypothetical protein
MDELALLKDFRLEDAAANGAREHARAALQSAMTRRRFGVPRRRYALVLAFAIAAVLAAAAYAIVHEFVLGAPAPKEDTRLIAYIVGQTVPTSIVPGSERDRLAGKPIVAAVTESRLGRMYLIVAPLRSGGACRYFVVPGLRSREGLLGELLAGGSECTNPANPPYLWSNLVQTNGGQMVEGYAPGAARVRIGRRFYETPIGWFLAEFHGFEPLTAYDKNGKVIGHATAGTNNGSG